MGLPAFLAFEMLVLGMIVAPILHCAFLLSVLVRALLGAELVDGSTGTVFYLAVLGLGYGSTLALTALGLYRLRLLELAPQQFWLPLYWMLIGFATVRAVRELVLRPFYWFKSPHQPRAARRRAHGLTS
jgi:hypothetical protein